EGVRGRVRGEPREAVSEQGPQDGGQARRQARIHPRRRGRSQAIRAADQGHEDLVGELARDDAAGSWHLVEVSRTIDAIELELEGERATALGDAGRKLEAALAELALGTTEERLDEAATAAWHYMILRESVRMFDHSA